MDGAEREDQVCDNTRLAVTKCWCGALTLLGAMCWSAWFLTLSAWFALKLRDQMWEERMEAGVQITPACTWAPESPRCEPVLDACPADPFEPLKPDGLLIPKQKFLPVPEIELGDPEELPLVKPAVRVHLL